MIRTESFFIHLQTTIRIPSHLCIHFTIRSPVNRTLINRNPDYPKHQQKIIIVKNSVNQNRLTSFFFIRWQKSPFEKLAQTKITVYLFILNPETVISVLMKNLSIAQKGVFELFS